MNPGKEKVLFQHWAENLAHGSRPTGHWAGLAGLARPCGLVLAKTLLGRIAPREKMRGRHCLASSSSSAQRLARWLPAAHAPERCFRWKWAPKIGGKRRGDHKGSPMGFGRRWGSRTEAGD
jgi:hypothetical protein